jgi:predicted nucleotidyltransferase
VRRREPTGGARRPGVSAVGGAGRPLLALYVSGSLVTGDFATDRSDLDLLSVLADDPDA